MVLKPTHVTEDAIWKRLVATGTDALAPDTARFFLSLQFPDSDKQRMHELAAKAREGTLSSDERDEIASYERIGSFVSIMKSKARKALRKAKAG